MEDEKESGDEAIASARDSSSRSMPHPSSLTLRGRPTWAEINLDNLIHNFRLIRSAVGPGVAVMPAVKADAYGHGAAECARALEREGAEWFGVAIPEEALKLREAGIHRPILCLGGFWEGQQEMIIERGITPVLFRLDLLEQLNLSARSRGLIADYHLKVDTGMGRLGVAHQEVEAFLDNAAEFENVRLDGLMTHFASADEPDDGGFASKQIALFESAVRMTRACGHNPTWIHQSNSAATLGYPQARGNLVRPGGVLYGLWRDVTNPSVEPLDWRPVMSLSTRIMLLKTVPAGTPLGYGRTFVTSRESRIATLAIGYEDGLSRALSNKGRVIVRGQFAPIVGRVSMDLTIIDVTGITGVTTGDEVAIIGSQGANRISAEDIAQSIGTISYEVTCRVSERVPRLYVSGQ